jgi:hypothetical protein
MSNIKCRVLAANSVVVAVLSGCGGGGGGSVPPIPPPNTSIDFSIFVSQAFSNPANSTPVSVDVDFSFDVNDDPTAFDSLILAGMF